MKEDNTTLRRIDILFLLLSGGIYSSSYLMARYEVTKPTIAQDISVLIGKYKIEGKAGPNGGYYYTGEPMLLLRERAYIAVRAETRDKECEFGMDILGELVETDKLIEKRRRGKRVPLFDLK